MVCRLFAGGRWIRTTGSAGRRDCPFRDHLDWPTAPSLSRETTYLARETWSSSPVCSCGESGELPIVSECIYIVVGDLVDNCTAPAVTPSTGRAVAGPLARIHLPPADSPSLVGFFLPILKSRQLPRRARPGCSRGSSWSVSIVSSVQAGADAC